MTSLLRNMASNNRVSA